jgi:membrane protease YdiL (CAAX protease family)
MSESPAPPVFRLAYALESGAKRETRGNPLNIESDALPSDHPAAPTPIEPIAPTQPSTVHKIFIGKDGLRAGWSLLIFIAIVRAVAFFANLIGHKFHVSTPKPGSEISPLFGILAEGIPFLLILLITWIMSKIEHRSNSAYGFGDDRKLPHFFAGMAWGVSCLSLLILTLVKTGLLVIDSRVLHGSDILRYGSMWLLGFFLVGLLEEYLTRGYVQYTLTRGLAGIYEWVFKTRHSKTLGFWTAALIFSILFGLGHQNNPGESPIGLLSAGTVGLVFCFSLWRTGSLWWAIGFHTSWDWGQSFLYGVADSGTMAQHHLLATHPVGRPILSGGATGPEGSIFVLAILGLVTLIIRFTLPRAPDKQAA